MRFGMIPYSISNADTTTSTAARAASAAGARCRSGNRSSAIADGRFMTPTSANEPAPASAIAVGLLDSGEEVLERSPLREHRHVLQRRLGLVVDQHHADRG